VQIKQFIKRLLFRSQPRAAPPEISRDQLLTIHDICLLVNSSDAGGTQYESKSSYEEHSSPLYPDISQWLDPQLVIDIGANYGFTASLFAKRFPKARIVLVEPSPLLHDYIRKNLTSNGITNYELVEAACGDSKDGSISFALNPTSSQDNRVKGEAGWKTTEVPVTTLSKIANDRYIKGGVFIKIDTQGYEKSVFTGGLDFLETHSPWLIKTEFAPFWLRSQGTDPKELLYFLVERFAVAEAPLRCRRNVDTLKNIFASCIDKNSVESFIEHTVLLNRDNLGWCDLLICPKDSPWMPSAS
jgi:FkbM family methyltransferase